MKFKLLKLGKKLFEFTYWEILGMTLLGWLFTAFIVGGVILYNDLNVYHNNESGIFKNVMEIEGWIALSWFLGGSLTSYLVKIYKKQHHMNKK